MKGTQGWVLKTLPRGLGALVFSAGHIYTLSPFIHGALLAPSLLSSGTYWAQCGTGKWREVGASLMPHRARPTWN